MILLISWRTQYIAFRKCITSCFYFFLFWFTTIHSNDSVKVIYFWNFRCSAKGAVLYSSLKLYVVLILFLLILHLLKEGVYKSVFLKFQVLRERSNVITSFLEHLVYSNFKMFSVLILGFSFSFVVTYPKSMCKSNLYFVILCAPGRKQRYCSFCGAPCI